LKAANDIFEPATPPCILSTKYTDAIFLARNFELTARTNTMKSQWKIVEPTGFEVQYYSNNAYDTTGEYRTCRIDVVVVVNKAERERTAVMEGSCCCSLTRRADFNFRRLEKRSGIRAGWTLNFERLGSGWRISILPCCFGACCLTNISTTSPIVCLLLVSPSCRSNACRYASCTTQVVQGFHGNHGSRSSRRSRSSQLRCS
jgi:hypothetical protein